MLTPNDVRKIAITAPDCREVKTKGFPDILSFMVSDAMGEPARIQVYCRTGTVGTCRVMNGEVREIYQRKCTLRQVHEIFKQPMELPNVDAGKFGTDADVERQSRDDDSYDDDNDENSTRELNRTERLTLQKDDQMVDIGLTILASEFDGLMSNFKSLLRDRQRREKQMEAMELAQERQRQQNMSPQQSRQNMMQMQQQRTRMQQQLQHRKNNQVQMQNSQAKTGSHKMNQKLQTQQMKKQQMRMQVHQLRQQKAEQR